MGNCTGLCTGSEPTATNKGEVTGDGKQQVKNTIKSKDIVE